MQIQLYQPTSYFGFFLQLLMSSSSPLNPKIKTFFFYIGILSRFSIILNMMMLFQHVFWCWVSTLNTHYSHKGIWVISVDGTGNTEANQDLSRFVFYVNKQVGAFLPTTPINLDKVFRKSQTICKLSSWSWWCLSL